MVFSLLVASSTAKNRLQRIPALLAEHPLAWRLLLAHLAFMLVFAGLSWYLFYQHPAGIFGNIIVVVWLLAGLAGCALASLAFAPIAAWLLILASAGSGWIYGLAAAIGAFFLGNYAIGFWQPLSRESFALVQLILHPFIPELILVPDALAIGTPKFMVVIAKECSGYEGIGLVLTFTAIWLWSLRREWRFPHALLLLPIGAVAIWLLNAVRIAALIAIGHAGASRIALGGFHSQAGWLMFTAVTLGFCLSARQVTWLTRKQTSDGVSLLTSIYNPATPYLAPFLAILAATLISRSAMDDFEWLYPLRVVVALAALWFFRSAYQRMSWRIGWPALAIGGLVSCIWIALDYFSDGNHKAAMPPALAESSQLARFTWLGFRVVGAVITVPIAEELAYRGFLMRRFTSRDFESVGWRDVSWVALLASSVAFGVLHGERWLAATIAGFFYAFVLVRRGSIGEAVAAHATTNGLLAAWVIFGDHWQMW